MATDDHERKRVELEAMGQNQGRFSLQQSGDQWRVIELVWEPEHKQAPRTDWMTYVEAMAERDRLFKGG